MRPERFLTASLRRHPRGPSVTRILARAMQAVEPERAVRNYLSAQPLPAARRIFVFGLGKAALAMSRAVFETLNVNAALIITKHAEPTPPEPASVMIGGHPIPDDRSLQAGQAALDFVSPLGADDLLLCLISGGGSALMSAPHPGLTLDDLQTLTRLLLACGARIDEINTLRRHLDRLKGGGLVRAASPARVVSLLLSDVVGSPLEAIASGPTAPDPSSRGDALHTLKKYGLTEKVPAAILRVLHSAPETPKPGESLFTRVENLVIGSGALAIQAALEQARAEGFLARSLGAAWQGEARQAAQALCQQLRAEDQRPFCLVAGGETTVTLTHGEGLSPTGLGGRNLELALAAAVHLAGLRDVMLVALATDGEDGPTDAAGAVVTGETALRRDPAAYLERHDSYHFFEPLGDLLRPGPSGTNVNDLMFLFGF